MRRCEAHVGAPQALIGQDSRAATSCTQAKRWRAGTSGGHDGDAPPVEVG